MADTTSVLKPKLTTFDTSMIVVSLVIGIGIFRTPALVAAHTGSMLLFFTAWILGGVISLMGALTFAEIGSRYPQPGGILQGGGRILPPFGCVYAELHKCHDRQWRGGRRWG